MRLARAGPERTGRIVAAQLAAQCQALGSWVCMWSMYSTRNMLVCLEPRTYNTSTYIVLPTLLGPRKKIECHDFVPLVNLSSLVPLPSHQTYEAALAQRVRKRARKQKNRDEVMEARRRAAASSMLPEDVGDDFDGNRAIIKNRGRVKYRKRDEAYVCTTSPVCAIVAVVCG